MMASSDASKARRFSSFAPFAFSFVAVAGLAATSSIRTIARDEQGVVLRLGRVVAVEPPGMHVGLPWPFERMERVRSAAVRTLLVGFTAGDAARGSPTAEQKQWLTGDRNIVEMQANVLYTVSDPVEYLFGAGGRADGRSVDVAIGAASESVLTSLFAAMPIDDLFAAGKTKLQFDAASRVQHLTDELHLGVAIRGVNIVNVNPPASVVSAFNDVQSARADRERSISEASGYVAKTVPDTRAKANRTLQDAEIFHARTVESARGAADAFLKLASEIEQQPELGRRRLWIDVVSRILGRGRKIVVAPATDGTHETLFLGR